MKHYITVLLIAIFFSTASLDANAAWGDFDMTFGFLGVSLDGIANHYPKGVAIQPDGKILVTGYRLVSGKKRFFLRRYLSNGQVDTSFGSSGSATFTGLINVEADYSGERIVVQANGRIAVYGTGNLRPTIWRCTSSGSGDSSMGSGGMKTLTAYSPAPSTVDSIATFSNILYVGVRTTNPAGTVILKFNSSGSQDTSFGSGGEAISNANEHFTVSVDPNGNILLGSKHKNGANFGVERFLPTGQLDPTFNHFDGVLADFGGFTLATPHMFIRRSNGEFAVNYRWLTGTGPYLFGGQIIRLTTNGTPTASTHYEDDPPFSSTSGNCPDVLAEQQDGRVLAKTVDNDYIFRFSSNFSTIGKMDCDGYTGLGSPTRAVLQSDDKMVAAGRLDGKIAIVRTLP